MDHLLGIVGNDFVLLAADQKIAHSVVALKKNQDKIVEIDAHKAVAAAGEFGDVAQLTDYIKRNMQLYQLRHGFPATTKAVAHYIRQEVAQLIRSNPHMCNMLLGGWDEKNGPQLYWVDYIGNMQQLNCGAHGYGGFFSLSVLDRHYRPGMSETEAVDLMRKCLEEINNRFLIGGATFTIKLVNRDGVRIIE